MNSFINTQEYNVEFYDGSYHELTDNQFGGEIFSQVDDEGHHFQILKEITDHN